MSDTNGKQNGKRKLPQALIDNIWQPGQSGNPKGGPPRTKLVDYMQAFFDEPATTEIDGTPVPLTKIDVNGDTVPVTKMEKFARMICKSAANEDGDRAVHLACMNICLEQLCPKPKQPIAFIVANPQFHGPKQISMIAILREDAAGGDIMPDAVMRMLESEARGELDDRLGLEIIEGDVDDNGKQ